MTTNDHAGIRQPPQLVSIRRAAEILAVSPRWLEYALARGEIQSVRIGRRRLLRLDDIASFIEEHVEEPREDVP